MKVLWFSNVPTPEMARRVGQSISGSGHWVAQLAHHVSATNKIELGIITAAPGFPESHFNEGGIEYFVIPQPRKYPAFKMRFVDLEKCVQLIKTFNPDIIHIHGSERFYGLIKATGKTKIPTLISIQGLLTSFSKARIFFGAMSHYDIFRSTRLIELFLKRGIIWQYLIAKNGAQREKKILSAVEGFLGRTEWDRSYAHYFNPEALYFHVGEILRPIFYESTWDLNKCERYSLIYTNASHPCRGTENLLAATALLMKEFPTIKLRLAGNVSTRSGYGRFIRRRVDQLGLTGKVDFLGYIDEKAMTRELSRAHVFTISSYIENSANSLCEAMMVGLPCVASFAGGTPNLLIDNYSGLLYPPDDVPLLAEKIRHLFLDDSLSVDLGSHARDVALARHDPQNTIKQLLEAYNNLPVSHK